MQVVPGPAVALALGAGAAGERLAATNGADARERLLLAGAALQLQDEHGNAAAAGGHRVRLSLHWPPGNQGPGPSWPDSSPASPLPEALQIPTPF